MNQINTNKLKLEINKSLLKELIYVILNVERSVLYGYRK